MGDRLTERALSEHPSSDTTVRRRRRRLQPVDWGLEGEKGVRVSKVLDEFSKKKEYPWRNWRPLSAHVDKIAIRKGEASPALKPKSRQPTLVQRYNHEFSRPPVPECQNPGSLVPRSPQLEELLRSRNERSSSRETARPMTAAAWLERKNARYGAQQDPLKMTTRQDLHRCVMKHEEVTRLHALGLDRKQQDTPPEESNEKQGRRRNSPFEDMSKEELALKSAPKQPSGNGLSRALNKWAVAREGVESGALTLILPDSSEEYGNLEAESSSPDMPRVHNVMTKGEGYAPREWEVIVPEDKSKGLKPTSRRALVQNTKSKFDMYDWKGSRIRPKTAPQGGHNPNLPLAERYPPCEGTRRVPTLPLEGEVELASETITWIDKNATDPRLKYHFEMDMERVYRSREFFDASYLHDRTGAPGSTHKRAFFLKEVEGQVTRPTDPLGDSLEAAFYRVLQGYDGLQPNQTKVRNERLELRKVMRSVMDALMEMFEYYRVQQATGGLPRPVEVDYLDENGIQTKLKGADVDMNGLINGAEFTVALTAVQVSEEVDDMVDIGEFEDLEAYEMAKNRARMEIASRMRASIARKKNNEWDALRAKLLLGRKLEGSLITFGQMWRCMHECTFPNNDVPLAAINRLICPPHEMLENQQLEIDLGRDFRAGYKEYIRWVTKQNTSSGDTQQDMSITSLAQLASAGLAAKRDKSQKAAKKVKLNQTVRHFAPGKTPGTSNVRAVSPERERLKKPALVAKHKSNRRLNVLMDSDEEEEEDDEQILPEITGLFSCTVNDDYGHFDVHDTHVMTKIVARPRAKGGSMLPPSVMALRKSRGSGSGSGSGEVSRTAMRLSGDLEELKGGSPSESPNRTPRVTGRSAAKSFSGPGMNSLEMFLEADEPHSPYAVGFAHQRSRVMDFSHFVEAIIRVAHARYYKPKWDNTVASCLAQAMELHLPIFRAAVSKAEKEEQRLVQVEVDVAAARQAAAEQAKEAEEAGQEEQEEQEQVVEAPRRPPAVVPNNIPAWQILMADESMQQLLKARQCRLMKAFLYYSTDLSEVPIEERLPGGPVFCFNELLTFLDGCEVMDAKLDPRKVKEIFQDITGASEVVGGVHKNNRQTEMTYDEFLECLVRCALVLKPADDNGKDAPRLLDHVQVFIDEMIFRHCAKSVPGKF